MFVYRTIPELKDAVKRLRLEKQQGNAATVGLVPTMGYLHEGHASLMKRARQENDVVVLSIFVNPTQFGPNEDFERYPRDTERDLGIAEEAGVDIVFLPHAKEMYPRRTRTTVSVSQVTEKLCGASRPGHFDGVSLVVSKLFHIVEPDNAYFGMKDAQQVAVIRTMVDDLNMPVNIVPCPIVRDADGLALSSRNVFLSPEQREQALVLSRTLAEADQWLEELGGDPVKLRERVADAIRTMPLADIDYVEVLSYPGLSDPTEWKEPGMTDRDMLIAVAVRFGATRLIDNRLLPIPSRR